MAIRAIAALLMLMLAGCTVDKTAKRMGDDPPADDDSAPDESDDDTPDAGE